MSKGISLDQFKNELETDAMRERDRLTILCDGQNATIESLRKDIMNLLRQKVELETSRELQSKVISEQEKLVAKLEDAIKILGQDLRYLTVANNRLEEVIRILQDQNMRMRAYRFTFEGIYPLPDDVAKYLEEQECRIKMEKSGI